MDANEYQKYALRTQKADRDPRDRLIVSMMGLCGEAGEASNIVKKHVFHGHDLDREHLKEELGDVAWYLAAAADAIGVSLNDILQANIDKLYARYPGGFDEERSRNREK